MALINKKNIKNIQFVIEKNWKFGDKMHSGDLIQREDDEWCAYMSKEDCENYEKTLNRWFTELNVSRFEKGLFITAKTNKITYLKEDDIYRVTSNVIKRLYPKKVYKNVINLDTLTKYDISLAANYILEKVKEIKFLLKK